MVEKLGNGAHRHRIGDRVGIPWLHSTDQTCEYCRAGKENLCDHPTFTGYTVDGGYAEYAVAPEDFVYALPESFSDQQVAPLLCAGIIGFRCLRLSGVKSGSRLAFYGFGAAAHVAIQVARHWGVEVYACTRGKNHQQLASRTRRRMGGRSLRRSSREARCGNHLCSRGELVPPALKALKKGGVLVLGGIHMSPIPSFDYDLLYQERMIRSVANNTRQDGEDFLRIAAEIPVRTQAQIYPLRDANRALNDLKSDRVNGAAVLDCRHDFVSSWTPTLLRGTFRVGITLKGSTASWNLSRSTLDCDPDALRNLAHALDVRTLPSSPSPGQSCRGATGGHGPYLRVGYLLSHGLVKIVLAIALWMNRLWAYPLAIFVFGASRLPGVSPRTRLLHWTLAAHHFRCRDHLVDVARIPRPETTARAPRPES